jgi:16S rRNA (guanine527-N7)-methyltransferase
VGSCGAEGAADRSLRMSIDAARRLGMLGQATVEDHLRHGRAFVRLISAVCGSDAPLRIVDLGSGGGVPGLVIAIEVPGASVQLVERREARADWLRMTIGQLDLASAEVCAVDAVRWSASLSSVADVVTARGFGPPWFTAEIASRLLPLGGHLVVSVPGTLDAWLPMDQFGFDLVGRGDGVAAWRLRSAPPRRTGNLRRPHRLWQ